MEVKRLIKAKFKLVYVCVRVCMCILTFFGEVLLLTYKRSCDKRFDFELNYCNCVSGIFLCFADYFVGCVLLSSPYDTKTSSCISLR